MSGRPKSIVWHYFNRNEIEDIATCNYCEKQFKTTHKTTSNMLVHLLRHHKKLIKDTQPYKTGSVSKANKLWPNVNRYVTNKKVIRKQKRRRSSVWNYFKRDDIRQIVVCTNCKKEFKMFGNTSNLRCHLLRCLKDIPNGFHVVSKKGAQSFIWDNFFESEIPECVICKYCNKNYKYFGNTSNLVRHLVRCRKGVVVDNKEMEDFRYTEDIDVDPLIPDLKLNYDTKVGLIEGEDVHLVSDNIPHPKIWSGKCRSFVWHHFQKTKIPYVAACNYCLKEIKTGGSTSNLKYHLMKYHQEKIKENDTITEEFSHNETDQKKEESFIWDHFERSDNTSTCIYCGEQYTINGNTANLLLHLVKHHKNVITLDVNGVSLNYDEETAKTVKTDMFNIKSEKHNRSFVWNHFKKSSNSNSAVCYHCKEIFKTSGNTTNLKHHLLRKHKEKMVDRGDNYLRVSEENELPEISGEVSKHTDSDECNHNSLHKDEGAKKRSRSFVWNHFQRGSVSQKATCNHCKGEYVTGGNTTNLRNHLMRFHKREVMKDVEEGDLRSDEIFAPKDFFKEEKETVETNTENNDYSKAYGELLLTDSCIIGYQDKNVTAQDENQKFEFAFNGNTLNGNNRSKRKRKSLVWNHFDKKEKSHTAICIHCGNVYNTSGNTSNLWDHLLRHHREQIEASDEENLDQLQTEELSLLKDNSEEEKTPKNRCRSIVWHHFEKSDVPKIATCVHCKEECNSSGNTTNLWTHLMRHHKEQIGVLEIDPEQIKTDVSLIVDVSNERKVSKKQRRSAIWNHFKESGETKKVICVHCNEHCNTSGNTTNLWTHLMRYHSQHIAMPEEETDALKTGECSVDNNLNDDESTPNEEIYIYCDKEQKTFVNTNLKSHLMTHHQSLINSNVDKCGNHVNEPYQTQETTSIGYKDNPVWGYFKKIVTPQFAVCNFCHMWCETTGNASNLNDHLMMYHKEDIAGKELNTEEKSPTKECTEAYDDQHVDFNDLLRFENGEVESKLVDTDTIWEHFEQSPDFPQFAACNHCNKLCKISEGAISLVIHLMNHHEGALEDNKASTNGNRQTKTSPSTEDNLKSFVWDHFERSRTRRLTVCNYCSTEFNTYKYSASLLHHLTNRHGEMIDNERLEKIRSATPAKEGGKGMYLHDFAAPEDVLGDANVRNRPSSSFVWFHFARSKIPQFAVCNHCKKLCNTYGSTSNLRDHLMRYHRELIVVESERISDREDLDVEEEMDCKGEQLTTEEIITNGKNSASAAGLDEYVILVVS